MFGFSFFQSSNTPWLWQALESETEHRVWPTVQSNNGLFTSMPFTFKCWKVWSGRILMMPSISFAPIQSLLVHTGAPMYIERSQMLPGVCQSFSNRLPWEINYVSIKCSCELQGAHAHKRLWLFMSHCYGIDSFWGQLKEKGSKTAHTLKEIVSFSPSAPIERNYSKQRWIKDCPS